MRVITNSTYPNMNNIYSQIQLSCLFLEDYAINFSYSFLILLLRLLLNILYWSRKINYQISNFSKYIE